MSKSVRETYLALVRDAYEHHIVADRTMVRLVFRRPGTTNYYIRYDIVGPSTLVVTGDLGCAVYQWSGEIDFAWLARLDLDYFVKKCQASEEGREFKQWSAEEARNRFNRRHADLSGEGQFDELQEFLDENRDEFDEALQTRDGWNVFADANLRDYWEDMDGMFDIGMTIAIRAIYHHEGLRLAMAQVKAAETASA